MTRPRPAAGGGRRLGVAPERLGRWLDGVTERHGAFDVVDTSAGDSAGDSVGTDEEPVGALVRLVCADSTSVVLRAPFPWVPEPDVLTSFVTAAGVPRRAAVLLVRRGRWAVGVFDGAHLVVSKVDSRQVQGRTAAGGWSQQRFARRRGHQTDAVVAAAADTAARVLLPHAEQVVGLFTGGDRGLVDEVLDDRRLGRLAALRRDPALDVGEPTKAVLMATPTQFRAVDVHIVEPSDRP